MAEWRTKLAGYFFAGSAVLADTFGILGFFGFHGDASLKNGVVGGLSLLGLGFGVATSYSVVQLWLSPIGAIHPPGYYLGKLTLGVGAVAVALTLAGFLLFAQPDGASSNGGPDAEPSAVPRPVPAFPTTASPSSGAPTVPRSAGTSAANPK
jgi:hypothetical protein